MILLYFILVAALALMPAARVHAEEINPNDEYIGTVSGNELSDNLEDDRSDQDFDSEQFDEFSDNYDAAASDLSSILEQLQIIDNDTLIELLSAYGSNTGVINEPYLTYIRSCLSWCTMTDKYVAFVSSYTYGNSTYSYYVCAIGDISYNGSIFTGSDIDVYSFYPNANLYGNFRHDIQATFSYAPGNSLCFTDISSNFPDIRGQDTKFLYAFLCVLGIVIVFYTVTKFGFGNVHIKRRSGRPVF